MQSHFLFFLKLAVFLTVVVVLGFYFFHQAKNFLMGPQLTVIYPQNGQAVENSLIEIKGRTINASLILVNNSPVLLDSDGSFKMDLLLARGYNIIDVVAKDKHDKFVHKKLELVHK